METGPLGKAGDPVALESSQKVNLLGQRDKSMLEMDNWTGEIEQKYAAETRERASSILS